MENQVEIKKNNRLGFIGKGSELFAIDLLNTVLIVITLGLYYPWAKAKKLKYIYQHTQLAESSFDFLGTGKEIFRGFIKAIAFLLVFYIVMFGFQFTIKDQASFSTLGIVFLVLFLLFSFVGLPYFSAYAIYGTFRYRSARSVWRGILFGYRIKKADFVRTYLGAFYFQFVPLFILALLIGFLAAFVSDQFGPDLVPIVIIAAIIPFLVFILYTYSYYLVRLYRITYGSMSLGNLEASFKGETRKLFWICLKGFLLSYLTMGIYFFWFKKNIYNFIIENMWVKQGEEEYQCKSTIAAGDVFELELVNGLLLFCTLGLAYSWNYVRTAKFLTKHIIIPSEIDLDSIAQTQNFESNATAEEMADVMDVDMGGIFF